MKAFVKKHWPLAAAFAAGAVGMLVVAKLGTSGTGPLKKFIGGYSA